MHGPASQVQSPSRSILVTSLLLALLAGSPACRREAGHEPSGDGGPAVAVSTVAVRIHQVPATVEASGTVRGRNTAQLSSKIPAYVKEIRVQAGDRVKAGQVIAVLEAPEIAAQRRQAEAALVEARAGLAEASNALEAARAQEQVATSTYQRFQTLIEKSSVTRQEFDEVEGKYKAAVAGREAAAARTERAQAGIAQAEAAVASARAMEAYTTVKSPFAGLVVEQRVDPGILAAPGVVLAVVEETGAGRVEAWVDESLAGQIRYGATAEVAIETIDREVVGRVMEVEPKVDTTSRSFLVKVELPYETEARPGLFARVRFRTGEARRMLIPRTAVSRKGQLDRVLVVEGGKARMRLVTLGESDGDNVEVLTGLSEGERLVDPWTSQARDGMAVAE